MNSKRTGWLKFVEHSLAHFYVIRETFRIHQRCSVVWAKKGRREKESEGKKGEYFYCKHKIPSEVVVVWDEKIIGTLTWWVPMDLNWSRRSSRHATVESENDSRLAPHNPQCDDRFFYMKLISRTNKILFVLGAEIFDGENKKFISISFVNISSIFFSLIVVMLLFLCEEFRIQMEFNFKMRKTCEKGKHSWNFPSH